MANLGNVAVSRSSELESTITGYLAQGFVVSSRDESGALLQKQKKFNIAALLLIFIPLLGWAALIIYIIVYAMRPQAEVVRIDVTESTPAS